MQSTESAPAETIAEEEKPNLSPTLTVVIQGKQQELFMSMNLLNALSKVVTSPEEFGNISADPYIREQVLNLVLVPRNEKGKSTIANFDYTDDNPDPAVIWSILDWASDHIINFTLESMNRLAKTQGRNGVKIAHLTSSLIGQAAAISKTPVV